MGINDIIKTEISLDEYLTKRLFSKKDIHLLKMEKRISVNDKIVLQNLQLKENDTINIDVFKDETTDVIPQKGKLNILYEDEACLIINKPAGILIHSDGSNEITLDNWVANYYKETNQSHPILHIHRLDKETTGCILYCKQSFLACYFDTLLKEKKIKRTYLAKVEGILKKDLTINKKIGKDRHINNKYRVSDSGKEAITHVKVIKHLNNQTIVKCILETGRTHQIRVHLSSINHPIVSDEIYGHKNKEGLQLHSYSIEFIHPITGKTIYIESPKY